MPPLTNTTPGILTATQKFGFYTASVFTKQAYGKNGCNNKSLKLYMKFECLTWKNNNDPRLVYDMETKLGASSAWPYLQYFMYLQKCNITKRVCIVLPCHATRLTKCLRVVKLNPSDLGIESTCHV